MTTKARWMQPTTQLLLSQDQQHRKAREDESLVTARLSRCAGRDFADYCTSDNRMLSELGLRPGVRRWPRSAAISDPGSTIFEGGIGILGSVFHRVSAMSVTTRTYCVRSDCVAEIRCYTTLPRPLVRFHDAPIVTGSRLFRLCFEQARDDSL